MAISGAGRFSFLTLQRSRLCSALSITIYGAMLPMSAAAQTVIGEGDTVTVPGSQSSPWNIPEVSPELSALRSHGALVVQDGGTVNSPSTSVGGAIVGGPLAVVTVNGGWAVWNTGNLRVAADVDAPGDASLTFANGATVNSGTVLVASSGTVFNPGAAHVSIALHGEGTVWNARSLWLGVGGVPSNEATLEVSRGAIINTSELSQVGGYTVSRFSGQLSTSSFKVTDAGSRWNADGGVAIDRQSQVTVTNGGVLSAPFARLMPGSVSYPFDPLPRVGGVLTVGGALDEHLNPLPATSPGILEVPVIEFAGRAGTLNFNHTSTDYVFGGRLIETGDNELVSYAQIGVYSGTTRLNADSSSFGGTIKIAGGRLLVDGKLGGAVLVSQGVLGGNGHVGSTLVGAGGTLAPGNSIGRLSVNGDLTFNPGSIFELDVSPSGNSDQIAVTGKATLNGGSLVLMPQGADFRPLTEYTILTASGGVTGAFSDVSSNYAFLSPSLSYQQGMVKLRLIRNDASFTSVAETPNQHAVAAGAESTGAGDPLWDAVAVMDPASARQAFDMISGEVHASTQGALIDDALVLQRVASEALDSDEERNGTWVKLVGRRAQSDADGNAGKLERDSTGVLVGGDLALGSTWHLGGLIGVGRTHNDVDARNSSSESDNLSAGIYADAKWSGGWRLRMAAIRTRHDIDGRRQPGISGIGNQFAVNTEARATQFFGELGFVFEAGTFVLEPFLGLSQIRLNVDGFEESGGVGALQSDGSESVTRYSTAGMRFTRGPAAGRWHFGGVLAWRHASGDLQPVSVLRFDGGQAFAIQGVPMSQDAAIMAANVTTRLSDRVSLGTSYLGQIASSTEDHGAAVWLGARF